MKKFINHINKSYHWISSLILFSIGKVCKLKVRSRRGSGIMSGLVGLVWFGLVWLVMKQQNQYTGLLSFGIFSLAVKTTDILDKKPFIWPSRN
jgi:hypothetical protein